MGLLYVALIRIIDVWIDASFKDGPEICRFRWTSPNGFGQEDIKKTSLKVRGGQSLFEIRPTLEDGLYRREDGGVGRLVAGVTTPGKSFGG